MDRGQADIVVADLGRQLGIASLALDESGMGILALDESGMIVSFGYNPNAGTIDLMTCLDRVEPSPARSLAAMRANFGWSAAGCQTLAIDQSTGAFVLQRRYGGADLVEGGLAGAVEGLVAEAERWTQRLASIADRPSQDPAPQANGGLRPGGLRA